MMSKRKYDMNWKIWGKKIGIILVEVLISGAIVYLTDNQIFLALIPALEGLRNYWKHR